MELRDLRYFLALADTQHFTRAALGLGIAQPSLSRQIKKLELELGAELFHRTKRSVALTSVGRAILNDARSLLAQAQTTLELARLAAGGKHGELRVGFIEIAAFALLPRLVAAFRRAQPKVMIKLTELTTIEQIAALREGSIDVGILRAPIPSDGVETVSIFRENLSVVLPSGHPLTKRASIKLSALSKEDFIFHSREKATRLEDEIASLARHVGYVPHVAHHAAEFHTICSLVAAGLGISLVPHSAQAIRISGLSYRKLTHPEINIEYCLGWLRGSRGPVIDAFRSLVVS